MQTSKASHTSTSPKSLPKANAPGKVHAPIEAATPESEDAVWAAEEKRLLKRPVVVTSQVSMCLPSNRGPGAFAIRLDMEDAVVTTIVYLPKCTREGLRDAAYSASQSLDDQQLLLGRAAAKTARRHAAGQRRRQPDSVKPGGYRDGFLLAEIRRDGAPEFDEMPLILDRGMERAAAFAEFACKTA